MPKKYVRECNIDLHYKDGRKVKVKMNLDLNASVDDQICNRFGEDNLKKWWWFEIDGPSMDELKNMLLNDKL